MRTALTLITLSSFGCAELRYTPRTEMVEVAPDPLAVAPPPPERTQTRAHRGRGLVIGGTIALLVGTAFIIGGAVGWQQQASANAAADAQCEAQQQAFFSFCGAFDNLSYAPYGGLIAFGGMAAISGLVLVGVGANRGDRQ